MPLTARDDRGDVSILFAFTVFAMFGIGALVVDAGTVLIEGRQLQNGAENAALVIAGTCAEGACAPGAGDATANGNALDGVTQVETVCGTAPGLAACTSTGERFDPDDGSRLPKSCLAPSGTAPFVQVHTRARKADGSPQLQGFMVRVMDPFMDPDYTGTEVRTCARAAYGTPAGLTGELPLTVSECEFSYWLGLFGLVNEPFDGTGEAVLYFHGDGDKGASGCPSRSGANQDSPGGFGWLTTTTDCAVATTVDGDATEKSGNSVPSECDAANFAEMLNKPVHIPIYSTVSSGGVYDITGYASFHLTGYRLSGNPAYNHTSATQPADWCTGNDRCISGYFTVDVTPSRGPLVAASSYGAIAIRVVG